MNQWKRVELTARDRVVAARARGEQPDPEDLAEARRQPGGEEEPLWVRRVAARATGSAPPEAGEPPRVMSEYEKRLRRRLGYPLGDEPDDAA